jgi:hypothetical protein
MWKVSRLAEKLSASKEGLCSLDFVFDCLGIEGLEDIE